MSGWVPVERELWGDELFAKEPMSEREAFIWMCSRAAWEDTHHHVAGVRHEVPRGSFMTTLRELQSVFMWRSDTRVRNFLKRLEQAGKLERTTCGPRNAPKTHVTICNYDANQQSEVAKVSRETHEKRSKRTNNNKPPSEAKASSAKVTDRDQGFSEFWKIWPHKVSKQAAQRAWRKLSLENRRSAYAAIRDGWFERWRAGNPDANGIHPSSFLNGQRWADEIPQPQLKAIDGGYNGRFDRSSQNPSANTGIDEIAFAARFARTPREDCF